MFPTFLTTRNQIYANLSFYIKTIKKNNSWEIEDLVENSYLVFYQLSVMLRSHVLPVRYMVSCRKYQVHIIPGTYEESICCCPVPGTV